MKYPTAMKMKDVDLHVLIWEGIQGILKEIKKQAVGWSGPNNQENNNVNNNDSWSVFSIYHVPGL